MPSAASLSALIQPGWWAAKLDLKEGYQHLRLAPDLPVCFQVMGQGWRMVGVGFGLNFLPRMFQQLMQDALHTLVVEGVIILIYLDDIIVLHSTQLGCCKHVSQVVQRLTDLGFWINPEKSHPQPSQIVDWLGYRYSTCTMRISLPPKKAVVLARTAATLSRRTHITPRRLASWHGAAVAARTALQGRGILLRETQHCIRVGVAQSGWDASVVRAEIRTWRKWMLRVPYGPIKLPPVRAHIQTDS